MDSERCWWKEVTMSNAGQNKLIRILLWITAISSTLVALLLFVPRIISWTDNQEPIDTQLDKLLDKSKDHEISNIHPVEKPSGPLIITASGAIQKKMEEVRKLNRALSPKLKTPNPSSAQKTDLAQERKYIVDLCYEIEKISKRYLEYADEYSPGLKPKKVKSLLAEVEEIKEKYK